jgi:hypothetical protein
MRSGDCDTRREGEIGRDFDREGTSLADCGRVRGEYCAIFDESYICRGVGCFNERDAGSCLGELVNDLLTPDSGALVVFEFEVRVVARDLRI